MRQVLRTVLLAVMAWTLSTAVMAQSTTPKQRMSREQLAEKQARHIAQNLTFSDDVTAKFIDTYCRCQKEIWALGPRQPRPAKGQGEQGAEQRIKQRFDMSEKILSIRRKYYEEYSRFLSQTQIDQVYKQERQMKRRLANRGKGKRPMSLGQR